MTATTVHPEVPTDSDLPEGWSLSPLSELCKINPTKTPLDALEADQLVTFVPMPAVDANKGAITSPQQRPFSEVRRGFTSFRDGDVIMAKITPCMENGKAAVARGLTNGIGFGSTEFHVLRSIGAALPEFLYYFIRQESFRRAAESEMTGSVGQKRVPAAFLESSALALPPLDEQERIVQKIEQLLSQVNAARERLARIPTILKRFRQAVLAAACSGRLTADWRLRNVPKKRIADVIRSVRDRRESEAKSSREKEQIRQLYAQTEESDQTELADGWAFVRLNKLCSSFDYGTSAKSQPSGKVPVLRMGNIQNGKIDWTDLVYTSDCQEIRDYALQPGTVLFNRTNSAELVGKTGIYIGERPAIFAGYLIRINHLPEIEPHYLNFCLNTPYAREFCFRVKADAVSQSNINAQKLGNFEVPFCSLDEQCEIVRRVNGLFKLADSIEQRVSAGTARADKLTQAILAKAFRGELVPTEAELARKEGRSYESASELLARIAAARQQDTPKQEKRVPRVKSA